MAELTTAQRKALPKTAFAIPEKAPGPGSYPIHDESHARNALSRVSANGTPEEQTRVRAAVHKRYPHIGDPDKDEGMSPSERISAWRDRKKGGK